MKVSMRYSTYNEGECLLLRDDKKNPIAIGYVYKRGDNGKQNSLPVNAPHPELYFRGVSKKNGDLVEKEIWALEYVRVNKLNK